MLLFTYGISSHNNKISLQSRLPLKYYYQMKSKGILQINATPNNNYLDNKFNPNWIVGRPKTYYLFCDYIHFIAGLNLDVENTSWK